MIFRVGRGETGATNFEEKIYHCQNMLGIVDFSRESFFREIFHTTYEDHLKPKAEITVSSRPPPNTPPR